MKDQVNMQYKISTNILELMKKDQVVIEQVNGQRKLNGPPPGWVGPPPGPRTEVFVGKLPREIYEDTVYPFFAAAGNIYELRLMMDFSGNNRGYCFVTYATSQEAENAVKILNDKEIIPGRKVGVIMSINNCKLWIGRLPKSIKSAEIILKICAKTADVSNVYVYRNGKNEAEFAVVEYKSHRGAAMARRTLVPDKNNLFFSSVSVDWANPDISPCNMIEESGLAVKDQQKKDLFILKEIRRKIIGCPGNRSFSSASKSREEILHENIECYIKENIITPTSDINMSSTPKQKQALQQASKVIQEPSNSSKKNSPFLLPRPIKLTEQPSPSFSLFDDFTFSRSPPNAQEDQGWAPSDQFYVATATQSICHKDGWIDEINPRFSNLSLQAEGARFLELGQRGKIGPINPPNPTFQPVVWPEKGFPFHQSGPSNVAPNSLQCACNPICVIPQQMPFELEKHAFFYNQHHCMPTSCAGCIEEFANSNLHRMPEPCSLPCCKPIQHVRIVSQDDVYQQLPEAYQSPASIKSRKKLTSGRSRKAVLKVNQHRRHYSENQEIPEQQNFISNKPAEQIPKGARPILSARK